MSSKTNQLDEAMVTWLHNNSIRESTAMANLRHETKKLEDGLMITSPEQLQLLAFLASSINAKKTISRNLKYIFETNNKNTHSMNLIPSGLFKKINEIKPDYVNLHWIGNEMISIKEICPTFLVFLFIAFMFHRFFSAFYLFGARSFFFFQQKCFD